MKNCLIMAIMAVASFSLSCLGADVTIVKEGDNAFRMGNGRISLLIDCNQGGAVMSYKDKLDGDVELLPDKGSARGLCIDHFQSQTWPGEMFKAKYENDEPRCDGKEAVLVLRYKTTGIWWNMSDEKVAGILLEKTYKLRSDSPVLECDIKLTSPKNDARLFAYWQQNIAYAGGTYEKGTDKTYRSSSRGVRVKDGTP